MFSMLLSHLYFPEFGLSESQNGILKLNPKYTSPRTLSDYQRIYQKLTEALIYCWKKPKRQRSSYTNEQLGGK